MKKIAIAFATTAILLGAFSTVGTDAFAKSTSATFASETSTSATTSDTVKAIRVTEIYSNVDKTYGVKGNNLGFGTGTASTVSGVTANTTQISFKLLSTNLGYGTADQLQLRNIVTGQVIYPKISSDNIVTFDTTGFFTSSVAGFVDDTAFRYQVELNFDGYYFGVFQMLAY